MKYHAIHGTPDGRVAVILVDKKDGMTASSAPKEEVARCDTSAEACEIMNRLNEELFGGRFLNSERFGMVLVPNE